MPELNLSVIAPVTDAEATRLVSPAAFADLATRIAATETPVAPHPPCARACSCRAWPNRIPVAA